MARFLSLECVGKVRVGKGRSVRAESLLVFVGVCVFASLVGVWRQFRLLASNLMTVCSRLGGRCAQVAGVARVPGVGRERIQHFRRGHLKNAGAFPGSVRRVAQHGLF